MSALSAYVRNIAIFLLFSSFVTIIIPNKKYEQYVKLVLGIVLILLIAAPLSGVINAISGGSGDFFADAALGHERAVLAQNIAQASEAQQELILQTFKEALGEQVRRLVNNHGHFTLQSVAFEIYTASVEEFGKILSMQLLLGEGAAASPGLIRIDPIRISPAINTRGEPQQRGDVENPHIMSLKNLLSDFYNLSTENILIETY